MPGSTTLSAFTLRKHLAYLHQKIFSLVLSPLSAVYPGRGTTYITSKGKASMLAELTAQQEIAELLAQVTEQEIKEEDVSHRLLFVSSLVILLVGVMYADNQVTESEKQRIKTLIGQFILPKSRIGQLVRLIFTGVQKQKTYTNSKIIAKLSEQLKVSERLLIIGLCHEVSAADGEISEKEEKYIEIISRILKVDVRYQPYLSGKLKDKAIDNEVFLEINGLLDPHHFQDLDPAFMWAADLLRAKLIPKNEIKSLEVEHSLSYEQLGEFQQRRNQLEEVTSELFELIRQGVDQDVLPEVLRDEAVKVLGRVRSQRFRLAVVGEFSQGKSTVLNALLGEEIQPVRAIPCSGTVTVLKYGEKHRVVCRYKDGREEEVPLEKYQDIASISQEAALSNMAEELSKSAIKEIIFEHPGLELCRHNVEIVDSPGLNEHPERTVITHQLLQNTDAVIFLANASRPFTQGEMELLKSLRQQLQGSGSDQPVENLFVLVNFMDLLRRDTDREHVKQRENNFLRGETPIIGGQNKLHFISAQAALDAMLEGRDDEYLQSFKEFARAIQAFLIEERGSLTIRQITNGLERLVQETRVGFKQNIDFLEGQVSLSEADQSQIMEQIGAASGREIKLRLLRNDLVDEALEEIGESWKEWLDGVEDRIAGKSCDWTSESEDKEIILRDFANQFQQDLSADLNDWLDKTVKDRILCPKITEFDKKTSENLNAIYENLKSIDLMSGLNLSQQFNLSLSHFGVDVNFASKLDSDSIKEGYGLLGAIGMIGGIGLAAGILSFLGFGLIPMIVYGGGFAGGLLQMLVKDPDQIRQEIKQAVCARGFDTFCKSIEEIELKIEENSVQAIDSRCENAIKAIQYAIFILDEILKKQEFVYQEVMSSQDLRKQFIRLKSEGLVCIESNLRSLLSTID